MREGAGKGWADLTEQYWTVGAERKWPTSILKWEQRSLGRHSTSFCLSYLPLEPLPEAAICYSGACYCSSHCFRVYLCVPLLWASSPLTGPAKLYELIDSQYLICFRKKAHKTCRWRWLWCGIQNLCCFLSSTSLIIWWTAYLARSCSWQLSIVWPQNHPSWCCRSGNACWGWKGTVFLWQWAFRPFNAFIQLVVL